MRAFAVNDPLVHDPLQLLWDHVSQPVASNSHGFPSTAVLILPLKLSATYHRSISSARFGILQWFTSINSMKNVEFHVRGIVMESSVVQRMNAVSLSLMLWFSCPFG